MRPYIKLWGREYPITNMTWALESKVLYATFYDEQEVYHTVFNSRTDKEPDREDKLKDVNLNENILWKEK